MILTRSYFKADIHIPNAQDTAPNSSLLGNGSKLDLFIEDYEREVLTKCLGFDLYNEFYTQFENNELKPTAHQKWKDLLNGKTYELNGRTVKFKGLIFKQGNLERSLIAYYIFYQFLKDDIESYTGTGIKQEKSKNAIAVSPIPKAVKSWRKFFELAVGQHFNPTIMYRNSGVGIDWLQGNTGERSLYQFINDSNVIEPNTYPNWSPYPFENLNQFGV